MDRKGIGIHSHTDIHSQHKSIHITVLQSYTYIHGQHRSLHTMVLHLQLHSWSTQINAHHGPTLTVTFMVNTGHCTSWSYTYNYIHGQHGSLHITVLHLQLHSWSTRVIARHSPTLTITFMVNTGHCTLQSYSVPPTFTVNTNHCTSWSYSKSLDMEQTLHTCQDILSLTLSLVNHDRVTLGLMNHVRTL